MKKIIKYLFLLTGGSFILASCNDFLDREPLDSVTPDNFFFTENDLAAYYGGQNEMCILWVRGKLRKPR